MDSSTGVDIVMTFKDLTKVLRDRVQREDRDRGMTLIELLVYMILLGIVLSLIMTIMISVMRKQREIVALSEANNETQTVVSSIDMAISNAANFTLIQRDDGGQVLIAKTQNTLLNEDTPRCVAYYYDAASKSIYSANDSANNASPRSRAAANAAAAAPTHWPLVLDSIVLVPGMPGPFSTGLDAAGEQLPGNSVGIHFQVETIPDRAPLTVKSTTAMRSVGGDSIPGSCW